MKTKIKITTRKNGRKLYGAAARKVVEARARRGNPSALALLKKAGASLIGLKKKNPVAKTRVQKAAKKRTVRKTNAEVGSLSPPVGVVDYKRGKPGKPKTKVGVVHHYRGARGVPKVDWKIFSRYQAAFGQRVKAAAKGGRRRKNSEVTELFQEFQGRPSEYVEPMMAADGTPSDLAELGLLIEVGYLDEAGAELLKFNRSDAPTLAIDQRGKMHIVGGNYRWDHPGNIGLATSVVYVTAKNHIGEGKTFEYEHQLGEEGGALPVLCADAEGFLKFKGGDYVITPEGIRN